MSAALHYPLVTDALLQEVVRRILSVGSPLKIILNTAKRTLADILQPQLRSAVASRRGWCPAFTNINTCKYGDTHERGSRTARSLA